MQWGDYQNGGALRLRATRALFGFREKGFLNNLIGKFNFGSFKRT